MQLALDPDGLVQSCDRCNKLIFNWDWMGQAFVTFDGQVVCNDCRTDMAKIPECPSCGKSDSMVFSNVYNEWVCHHTHVV